MEKKKGTLGQALGLLAKGIALRKERAKESGKTTAQVLMAETRGDLFDEQMQVLSDKIRWLKRELELNNQNLSESELEAKENEIRTLEEKRQQLKQERDRLYKQAEVPEDSSKFR